MYRNQTFIHYIVCFYNLGTIMIFKSLALLFAWLMSFVTHVPLGVIQILLDGITGRVLSSDVVFRGSLQYIMANVHLCKYSAKPVRPTCLRARTTCDFISLLERSERFCKHMHSRIFLGAPDIIMVVMPC